jgi:prepilin-type N-terminal cleavage/methylation domain-containing protein
MKATKDPSSGYSLVELLVVLAIVGILSIVSVTMVGNRPAAAVHGILDELEGVLASAHKRAVATGQDVVITTSGEWSVPNILTMTFTGASSSEGFTVAHSGPAGAATGILREHMHGGVVTVTNADWWTTAQGTSTNINDVPPFDAGFQVKDKDGNLQSLLKDGTLNLFQGGAAAHTIRISGTNKRFTTNCWIEVVGLSNGLPIPGGPMGVIVVQANGATIYKFYNSGSRNGDGNWRRI